ncbi:MAG: hypothetical protein H0U51_00570 [Propionibacteriales bacterium]|nr:hypothetical protein [Propionibacteriales bacterium]
MNSVTLAAPAAGVHDFFNSVEEVLVDDGFMATREVLLFVNDNAGVIGVPEHLVQLTHGQRSCSPTTRRARGQTLVGQGPLQPLD